MRSMVEREAPAPAGLDDGVVKASAAGSRRTAAHPAPPPSGWSPSPKRERNPYFAAFARAMPSMTICWASAASPQRTILTHLPGSRSL